MAEGSPGGHTPHQFITLPLDHIKPYWRNPRINEDAVKVVAQSIEDYGFNSPLVLDPEHTIIAGHTRYRALRSLGYTQAPCVVVQLPPEKVKAYRIADNKTSEVAQWDLAKLIPELRELGDVTSMEIYFPEFNLKDLVSDTAAPDFAPPSNDDVRGVSDELNQQFADRSGERIGALVDVSCPNCGNSFAVSRSDFKYQP